MVDEASEVVEVSDDATLQQDILANTDVILFSVCVNALRGIPEVACEKPAGVEETKQRKGDKRAHAEPTPPPRLQVLLHHLDGKTKFESEPVERLENSATIDVQYLTSYALESSQELMDRIFSAPMLLEVVELVVEDAEPIQKRFGSALIDLSSLIEGVVELSGWFPLQVSGEDVGGAEVQLNISLSRELSCETEWERSTRGTLQLIAVTGLPERWVPRSSAVPQSDDAEDESKDDTGKKGNVVEETETISPIRRRFTVEFQWPLSWDKVVATSEDVRFTNGEASVHFSFERPLYISADSVNVLETSEPVTVFVRAEIQEVSEEEEAGREFVLDPISAVGELQLPALTENDVKRAGGVIQLRMSGESKTFAEQQQRKEIEAEQEALLQANEEAEKSKNKKKGKEKTVIEESVNEDDDNEKEEENSEPKPIADIFEQASTSVNIVVSTEQALRSSVEIKRLLPTDIVAPFVPAVVEKEPPTAEDLLRVQLHNLLHELAESYDKCRSSVGFDTDVDVRKEVVFALNQSGVYYAFKERLKVAVARMSHDNIGDISDRPVGSEKISSLYKVLVKEAAGVLNEAFTRDMRKPVEESPPPSSPRALQDVLDAANEARFILDVQRELAILRERVSESDDASTEDGIAVRLELFRVLIREDERQEANNLVRDLVAHNPEDVSIRRQFAFVLLELDAHDSNAALLLRHSADSDGPDRAINLAARAVGLRLSGHDNLAAYCLRHAVMEAPEQEDVLLFIADFALSRSTPAVARCAVQWHRELHKHSTPGLAELELRAAQGFAVRGEWKQCIEHCRASLVIDRECIRALVLEGNAHWTQGNRVDAQKVWEDALRQRHVIEPVDCAILCGRLGIAYMEQEMWEPAVQVFGLAIQQRSWSELWKRLGESLLRCKRPQQAVDALAQANMLNNRDPETWGLLALSCTQLDRFVEARQCSSLAKSFGIQRQDIWRQLVQLLDEQKRYDEASDLASNIDDPSLIAGIKRKQNLMKEADEIEPLASFGEP